MRFKSLALASAATAALGVGFATPALAQHTNNNNTGTNENGCNTHCDARVFDHNGKAFATVHVDVTSTRITGTLHALRNFQLKTGDDFDIRGHCRPEQFREEREQQQFTPREREVSEFNEFREEREVPREAIRTGFGGSGTVNMPLVAGALSIITAGIGLGGIAARRRLSSVRS